MDELSTVDIINKLINYGIPKSVVIGELGMSRKTFLKYMDEDGFKNIHRVAIISRWEGLFNN